MLTTMEAAVVRSGSVSQDGISSRGGATEAKLKLLEARLTGGGNGQQRRQDLGGDPGLDDVLGPARFGSSRSPLAAVPAANGRLGTPPPVVPGKQQRPSTSGGRGEAAQSCLLLASPSVQLDTSLDSEDVSGSRGSRGGWGIQGAPGCGGGTTSRRVSLPGGKGESLQGALQAAEEGARDKETQKRKAGNGLRLMDRDSTPPALERSGSKGVSSAAKRQNTINRYFQAAVESCSQGSDSIAREDKEPTETINLISQSQPPGVNITDFQMARTEIEEIESRNQELRSEVDGLRARLEEAERDLRSAERRAAQAAEEAEAMRTEVAQMKQAAEEREQHAHEAVRRLAQQCSRFERQAADAQLQQDALRLGSIGVQRTGTVLTEVWVDGPAFQDLNRRQAEMAETRESIEALRKAIKKQLPLPGGPPAEGGSRQARKDLAGTITPAEYVIRDEALRARLQALKREEDTLAKEKDRLEVERVRHIRELKRRKDEDDSRFSNTPELHNRYVLMNLLGKGGFSEVYRAFDLQEMREVAVKVHHLNSGWSEAKKQSYVLHAVREYKIHKSLCHPRVVGLLDIFEVDDSTFATVLEVCNGGDLESHLREHNALPEREARAIVVQIIQGLAYLNEPRRRIIHYDLKPANILFDSCGEVKITDFGLSKIVEEGQTNGMELTSQGAGTYWYLPPECFETSTTPPIISSKVDVWSVGVIFYQMLFGKRPFGHELSQEKILREKTITHAMHVEFPSRPSVSQEAKEFIRRCLAYNQAHRPDVHEAAADQYLTTSKGAEKRGR